MMIEVKKMFLQTRVTVPESWRALALVNGKYHSILRPGRHVLASFGKSVSVEGFNLAARQFTGTHEQALIRERPDLAAGHLTDVRTSASEVAVVSCDGKLFGVLKPDSRHLFWTDAGPWSVEMIDVSEQLD